MAANCLQTHQQRSPEICGNLAICCNLAMTSVVKHCTPPINVAELFAHGAHAIIRCHKSNTAYHVTFNNCNQTASSLFQMPAHHRC
eukprot:m.76673 g.76673  ORF g.76673 m.76673 type:complete len:86 (-) comp12495_c1_seq2:28-285(-)